MFQMRAKLRPRSSHSINIIAIAQGSSEYNVSFVVERDKMRDAVAAVHNEFGLQRRAARFESTENENILSEV
jgi:aspartokinase